MTASFSLDLIFNVQGSNSCSDVCFYSTDDIRRSSEAKYECGKIFEAHVSIICSYPVSAPSAMTGTEGFKLDTICPALAKSFNVAIAKSGCPRREAVVAAPLKDCQIKCASPMPEKASHL